MRIQRGNRNAGAANCNARTFFSCSPHAQRGANVASKAHRAWHYRSSISGMKLKTIKEQSAGKVGWVLLWLLGVPIPVLLILFLLRGCT
jgi:hypothetical protein